MDRIPQAELTQASRSIVARIAPQELLVYRLHAEEFFRDPVRAVVPPRPREDVMGFGAGEAVQMVTPLVLMAMGEVVRAIGDEILRQLGDSAREGIRSLIPRLFGGPGASPVRLSPEQLRRVEEVALANAGPDPALARRIAEGIVAALAQREVHSPAAGQQTR